MNLLRSHSKNYFTFLIVLVTLVACDKSKTTSPEAKLAFESVIPKPMSVSAGGKTFFLTDKTKIVADSVQAVQNVATYLAEKLNPATGLNLSVVNNANENDDAILLTTKGADAALGAEGYELIIEEHQIKLVANTAAGLFRGVQTIRQILPAAIEASDKQENVNWEIATGTIRDQPLYSWRGSMLDVARHFFSVEDVKRYIDLMSLYKMNVLHLHLSDDQGWRIEIKSWPNLTKIGGETEVGGGKAGFYTQDQYADIVAYAQKQFITIVPEIDMPGHINAALASYAELNAGPPIKREPGLPNPAQAAAAPLKEKPVAGKLYTGIEVGFSTLTLKKEITLKFVDDVMRELAALTPGPYLHIGGDEAAVTKKEDYIQFINKFKTIVESHGKKMMGWEEIAQGDIDSSVVAQYWHSEKYSTVAADKGAKLVFSPSKKVYLDMQYDSTSRIGLHWAAYIEVDSSYIWDPATLVPGISPEQILGVEAPLWSETVENVDDIEYLVFPRLPGVAEIGWTKADQRQWNEYKERLGRQSKRWDLMKVDYYPSQKVQWQK